MSRPSRETIVHKLVASATAAAFTAICLVAVFGADLDMIATPQNLPRTETAATARTKATAGPQADACTPPASLTASTITA